MSQEEMFDDLREALGCTFELQSDEFMDELTQGTWIRVRYQFKDLIRELLRSIGIKERE